MREVNPQFIDRWKKNGTDLIFFPVIRGVDQEYLKNPKVSEIFEKVYTEIAYELARTSLGVRYVWCVDYKSELLLVEQTLYPEKKVDPANFMTKVNYYEKVMGNLDNIGKLDESCINVIELKLFHINMKRIQDEQYKFSGLIGLVMKIIHLFRQWWNGYGFQTRAEWQIIQQSSFDGYMNTIKSKRVEQSLNCHEANECSVKRILTSRLTYESLSTQGKDFLDIIFKDRFIENDLNTINTTFGFQLEFEKLKIPEGETFIPNPFYERIFELIKKDIDLIPAILQDLSPGGPRTSFAAGLLKNVINKVNHEEIIGYLQPEQGSLDTYIEQVFEENSEKKITPIEVVNEETGINDILGYYVTKDTTLSGYLFKNKADIISLSNSIHWHNKFVNGHYSSIKN